MPRAYSDELRSKLLKSYAAGRESLGYQPISADWQTLTAPITKRLHGHNQVTDAYLLGLALREGMVLVTLDRALLHLAGEHRDHVLLLGAEQAQ